LQIVVSVIISVTAGLSIVFRELIRGGMEMFDEAAMTTLLIDELMQFVFNNIMLIILFSNIAGLGVFIPMWMKTRKNLDLYKNNNPVIAALLTAGFFAGFNIVQMFVFSATDVMKYFPSYDDLSEAVSGGSFLIQLLTVGVSAPVIEELVFRGILMGRMKWLPVWASVIIQAMLFGIAHMNLFQSLYAFLAGILLALVYVKYKSITIAIIGHMAYNIISSLLGEYLTEDSAVLIVLVLALAVLAAVVCAILLIKRHGANLIRSAIPEEPYDSARDRYAPPQMPYPEPGMQYYPQYYPQSYPQNYPQYYPQNYPQNTQYNYQQYYPQNYPGDNPQSYPYYPQNDPQSYTPHYPQDDRTSDPE